MLIGSLSRGLSTKRWVAGTGAQDQFPGCLRSSFLLLSMQDPAPPESRSVSALNPSVVQKGCLLQWCKAETAEDKGQPPYTSWDFVSYSPLPPVPLLFPLFSVTASHFQASILFSFTTWILHSPFL